MEDARVPTHKAIEPAAVPARGSTVHLLLTCLCDAFFPEAAKAAVECLEAAGFAVEFDERQTCCGQPAFNSGEREAARQVARHTIDVFKRAGAVVVPSGSCAAMIRWGYPRLFEGQRDLPAALDLAGRTFEFHEFLILAGGMLPWPGAYAKRVALHSSCHMRELKIPDAAARLLASVSGLELCAPDPPEQCCGFGGTFAVTFPWTSAEIGGAKLEALRRTGAAEVVSTDMSCLMHLNGLQSRKGGEGKRAGLPMRHCAELLRDSLGHRS